MSEIKVEDAAHGYVHLLNKLRVDYVFGSPGSEFIPIWEHLLRFNSKGKKPYYINVRHESAALSMAKGYFMASGKAQVLLTHVITGLLHGAMELKAAYTDDIPLILVVGQNKTHDQEVYGGTPGPHYLSFTEIGGQQKLVQAYVKWSETPETNKNILNIIQRGYQIASSDIKGPVLLNISRELLFEKIEKMTLPLPIQYPTLVAAAPQDIKSLSNLLQQANNPLIYTRYLGRNRDSVNLLIKLVELLGIPVFEIPGYMNFPTNNTLHMGTNIQPYIKDADLILVIDSSSWPPWYPPKSIKKQTNAKIVFLDLDPLQLKYPVYSYPADLLVNADSNVALYQLIGEITQGKVDQEKTKERMNKWSIEHKRIRDNLKKQALNVKEAFPIDPKWLCYCIDQVIDTTTIVVHETITHGRLIHQYIENNRYVPGSRYEASGPKAHTGLGQGLGVALGVKLAEPEKTVVALEGDGSFNYNPISACFGAAQEYEIPFMTIIFNNSCYAAMKSHPRYYPDGTSVRMNKYYGVSCGPTPQYEKLVEAYEGYAETITYPNEVKPALQRAFNQVRSGKLTLLDIRIK
jgi:thiamine pyrophosphate-dependent acetolactate synthase large subunit-like protein